MLKLLFLCTLFVGLPWGNIAHSAGEDESNPLLDMASMFIQEALNSQNMNGAARENAGGSVGLAGIASLISSLVQTQGGENKGASGAMQILSGLGSLMANAGNNRSGGGNTGFDPSIIGNVIDMFTNTGDGDSSARSHTNSKPASGTDANINYGLIMQMASAFMSNNNNNAQQQPEKNRDSENEVDNNSENEESVMNLLPLLMQAVSSFAGSEGHNTQQQHKDHAWVLPPFLEHIHVLLDHFSKSELADALYKKSGANKILKVFKDRDGKIDYDKLFESLNNQSFRRRWIKAATLYLSDWASYLANPEIYLKYFQTTQLMFNGFLKTQGYPKTTYFDPQRPSETISNLLDYVAKQHLNIKIDSSQYVKPGVVYAKQLLKLGQARGLLQFNSTEISDKLTDTLNLEVIEPVLKVYRAYRFIKQTPQCDRYVLCSLNSNNEDPQNLQQQKESGVMTNVSSKIIKIGSMGAAIFISTDTGTPFWILFGVINSPHNCEVKYPVDCSGFHVGEAKVTTEYIHNEL